MGPNILQIDACSNWPLFQTVAIFLHTIQGVVFETYPQKQIIIENTNYILALNCLGNILRE